MQFDGGVSQSNNHDHDQLAAAVGRVTICSAMADDRLRDVMQAILGIGGNAWILAEGQSTEWVASDVACSFVPRRSMAPEVAEGSPCGPTCEERGPEGPAVLS
jgi:hypothetical protein